MREKRIRTKLFNVWLHPKEHQFLNKYAEKNLLSASELFRGWLHQVMKSEGYEIKEPQNPETIIKIKGGKK